MIIIYSLIDALLLFIWLHYIDSIPHETGHARKLLQLNDSPIVTIKTKYINTVFRYNGITYVFNPNVTNKTFSKCNYTKYSEKELRRIAFCGLSVSYIIVILTAIIWLLSYAVLDFTPWLFLSVVVISQFITLLIYTILGVFNSYSDVGIMINPSKFLERMNTLDEYNEIYNMYILNMTKEYRNDQ